jgi:hypothetical protein
MIQFENGTSTTASSTVFVKCTRGFHDLIIENKNGCGLSKEVLQY